MNSLSDNEVTEGIGRSSLRTLLFMSAKITNTKDTQSNIC